MRAAQYPLTLGVIPIWVRWLLGACLLMWVTFQTASCAVGRGIEAHKQNVVLRGP